MSDNIVDAPRPCWCCGGRQLIKLESGGQYCYDCMADPLGPSRTDFRTVG